MVLATDASIPRERLCRESEARLTSSEATGPSDRPVSPGNSPSAAPAPHPASGSSRPVRTFAILLLLLGAAYTTYIVVRSTVSHNRGEQHPAVGRDLFFINLRGVDDNRPVSLSDLKGGVTLLNFWGTWCPPCREELPRLQTLAERFAPQDDFRLLAISYPQESGADNVALAADTRDYLTDNGLKLPAYLDSEGQTRSAIDLVVPLAGYPTTIILDRNNRVRGVWMGYQRGYEQEMEALVGKLLAEPLQIAMPEITITGNEYLVPIEDDESPP